MFEGVRDYKSLETTGVDDYKLVRKGHVNSVKFYSVPPSKEILNMNVPNRLNGLSPSPTWWHWFYSRGPCLPLCLPDRSP
jgi:hypothetical protein